MTRTIHLPIMTVSIFTAMVFLMAGIGHAATLSEGHSKVEERVTADQGGVLAVKTSTGTRQLNANDPRRMTIVLDENDAVMEAHLRGQDGRHHFYTGKLLYTGKRQEGVKMETTAGVRVFPLGRLQLKTKGIKEGTIVTVEVNEAGTVIDLHRGSHGVTSIYALLKTPE
ncbi:MAG TPA: hypothetical protein PKK23_02330 [Nitrospirales bacterium]|nr:hypothetical protein [Nitrospiraceae bacterium]HNP27853.1 hypothetical protein [Nitrospirales bacterium]